MYRVIIVSSYILLGISIYGFENQGVFSGQLLALLGILVTISFLVSPVMVWQSIKDYSASKKSKASIGILLLSVTYLLIVVLVMYKIWPQLMSV